MISCIFKNILIFDNIFLFIADKLILWLPDRDTLIEQPLILIMTNGDRPPARIRSLKSQDGKLQSHLEWPKNHMLTDLPYCYISGGSRGVSGVSTETPLRFQKLLEDLMEDALKLKFLERSATHPFS